MQSYLHATPKCLHEMDRLEDMGRFPIVIYIGATGNVLASILLFFWLHRYVEGSFPIGFICAMILLACNLLPVIILRQYDGAEKLAATRPVESMSFLTDQHRFASWVYAVASGNLLFWLMLAWAAFDIEGSGRMLLGVESLAFICTFAPAWLRFFRR